MSIRLDFLVIQPDAFLFCFCKFEMDFPGGTLKQRGKYKAGTGIQGVESHSLIRAMINASDNYTTRRQELLIFYMYQSRPR